MNEVSIKRDICDYLARLPACFFWIQSVSKIPGRCSRSKYQRNGIPDICGMILGTPLYIEVKTKVGIVSASQLDFLAQASRCGAIAFVARSLTDVVSTLSPLVNAKFRSMTPCDHQGGKETARNYLDNALSKTSRSKP